MKWDWSAERGWFECPTPTPAPVETSVGDIDKVNVMWPPRLPVKAPSGAADVMALNGILRSDDVIHYAAAAGLDLAAACVMLEMESSGGHNVWGHDGVPTGGCYVKGSEVTKTEYLCYKSKRAQIGCQGVGPCQLTYGPLQDQADNLGGAWIWENNIQVGFGVLAGNIKRLGLRDGFKRYNGSGPAADAYAAKAMAKYEVWKSRLASAPPVPHGDNSMATVPQDQWNSVFNQLCGTFKAWGGGITDSQDTPYTLLQFVMRCDVEIHQARLQLQAIQDKLDAPPTGLSDADVQRIAAAVVELQKPQSQP